MAAVAGSKGRLSWRDVDRPSVQIETVRALLTGAMDAGGAARRLLDAACIREIGVDTNMVCNLACQYCYLSDRAEERGSVPLDVLVAKLLEAVGQGAKLLAFIGKEPLADDRAVTMLGILNDARRQGLAFRTGMVTNGTLVTRWLDELIDADLSYLDVSIDGLTDWENQLRGSDVTKRVKTGVDAVVRSSLRDRFATASVLTETNINTYPQFVEQLFGEGVQTCFSSPVLKFAMSKEVGAYAVSPERITRLLDALAKAGEQSGPETQVIVDLPYRYSWMLLRSGEVRVEDLQEDQYEALFWQLSGSNVFLKLNPFSYSFWRALRITHDGSVMLNMDLAAHAQYAEASLRLSDFAFPMSKNLSGQAAPFLVDFIEQHLHDGSVAPYERDLAGQFRRSNIGIAA